uniref:Uncharacterized protein n=1 Tax=Ixodes ricinus TaxID=34613 RepID=A0A6B0UUI2_IXORI
MGTEVGAVFVIVPIPTSFRLVAGQPAPGMRGVELLPGHGEPADWPGGQAVGHVDVRPQSPRSFLHREPPQGAHQVLPLRLPLRGTQLPRHREHCIQDWRQAAQGILVAVRERSAGRLHPPGSGGRVPLHPSHHHFQNFPTGCHAH